MKYAACIVLPSNKRDTIETNFQNIKLTIFKSDYLLTAKLYMNDIHSV